MSLRFFRSSQFRPAASSRGLQGKARRRRSRFAPDLLRLETRALLSTLWVTNDSDNPASGSGSLRGELAAAGPGDTIQFKPSAFGTITLTNGPLSVSTDLTIQGPGASEVSVSGNAASTVFDVPAGVTASISGLTITDGSVAANAFGGGGISNYGTLSLSNAVVTGNSASPYTFGAGGVFNGGTLTIAGSTISGNSGGTGGGINNFGTLSIHDSHISGNSGTGQGGGLNTFTSASLDDCVVSANVGGGIAISTGYGYAIATLTVTDSVVVGNTNDQSPNASLALGAGISSFESAVTVTNSLIANNIAKGSLASGAGIFMGGFTQSPQRVLTLTDSTISGNQAIGTVGAGEAYGGGVHNDSGATIVVSNCSFLNNAAIGINGARGGAMDLAGLAPSTITGSTFVGNQARNSSPYGGGSATGGAISQQGGFPYPSTLTITGSTFAKNTVEAGPGGGFGLGGAIINEGQPSTLNLSSDLFTGNLATGGAAATASDPSFGGFGAGGALVNAFGATANVNGSTFIGNTAVGGAATGNGNHAGPGEGGAIQNAYASLTISNSTFAGNTAIGGAGSRGATGGDGIGGAIQDAGSSLQFSGGTVIGNRAIGGRGNAEGGGVAVTGGSAAFTNVLISLNAAIGGTGGGSGYGGGLYIGTGALTTLKNTRVRGNLASTAGNDIYGPYTTG